MRLIIWINGAFGAGKTQTAYELHLRIPNSFVYDPENFGFFIRKNIPKGIQRKDFQDEPIWRETNYSILKHLDREYDGVIIVPMTIVNMQYFEETIGKLKSDGITVHHFVLWASKETIQKRLRSRGEGKNSWGAKQIDRCLEGLVQLSKKYHEPFHYQIDTNQMSVEQVADAISTMTNIPLSPDNKSKLRKKWDRMKIQLKHIRF